MANWMWIRFILECRVSEREKKYKRRNIFQFSHILILCAFVCSVKIFDLLWMAWLSYLLHFFSSCSSFSHTFTSSIELYKSNFPSTSLSFPKFITHCSSCCLPFHSLFGSFSLSFSFSSLAMFYSSLHVKVCICERVFVWREWDRERERSVKQCIHDGRNGKKREKIATHLHCTEPLFRIENDNTKVFDLKENHWFPTRCNLFLYKIILSLSTVWCCRRRRHCRHRCRCCIYERERRYSMFNAYNKDMNQKQKALTATAASAATEKIEE